MQPEVTYAAISTEIQRSPDEDPEPLGNQPIVKLIQETGENALLLGERGSGDKGCRWQQQQYKHIRDKG